MALTDSGGARLSAPLWRRFAALLYDFLVLTALSMAYVALTMLVYVSITGDTGKAYTPMFDGLAFQLGWLAMIVSFYGFFWRRGGQTLGMRAWRLRLESHDGTAPSLKQCALRCLCGPFALALAGMGYWWLWLDRDGLCLHDRLSGTRVAVVGQPTSYKL